MGFKKLVGICLANIGDKEILSQGNYTWDKGVQKEPWIQQWIGLVLYLQNDFIDINRNPLKK